MRAGGSYRLTKDWGRHEGEDEDEECQESAEFAVGIKRQWIVDRSSAQEADAEEQRCPDIPPGPIGKITEGEKKEREEQGKKAMSARTDGTHDVAAVELASWQKIERCGEKPDPGGAADGWQQKSAGSDARMEYSFEKAQEEWCAKDDFGVSRVGESGN